MIEEHIIGRVLRATTRGFACGTSSRNVSAHHDFGAFVRAPVANQPDCYVIGLVYAVEIKDDQLITELVMSDGIDANVLADQRQNRMVPVEVDVLNVGYMLDGAMIHSLPPRPPMSLSDVVLCDAAEVYHFTQRPDFFRLVLNAPDVPSDDLIAAALRGAVTAYPEDQQYAFMVGCGRHLARLLSGDLRRLSHVLSLLRL